MIVVFLWLKPRALLRYELPAQILNRTEQHGGTLAVARPWGRARTQRPRPASGSGYCQGASHVCRSWLLWFRACYQL